MARLSINEGLTLLVALGGLAVSYVSYLNAKNNDDMKVAIKELQRLTGETKKLAEAADLQADALALSVGEQQLQTKALGDQATQAQRSAGIAQSQLDTSVRALALQGAGQIRISASMVPYYGRTDGLLAVPWRFENVGDHGLSNVRICTSVAILDAGKSDRLWEQGFRKDQCAVETIPRASFEPGNAVIPRPLNEVDYDALASGLAEIIFIGRATFRNPGDSRAQQRDVCYRFFGAKAQPVSQACPTPESRR